MTQRMPLAVRLAPLVAQRLPQVLVWSHRRTAPCARWFPGWCVRHALRTLPDVDQQVVHDPPDVEALFRANMVELNRHGGRGVAHALLVVSRAWGFQLKDMRANVAVWHGERDANIPPKLGRYLAHPIPTAPAHSVPEAGQFLTFSHWGECLPSWWYNINAVFAVVRVALLPQLALVVPPHAQVHGTPQRLATSRKAARCADHAR
jgi:hypothetical protein